MSDEDQIREIVLELNDDLYGVYEVGWSISGSLDVPPQALPVVAAQVLEDLLRESLIEVWVQRPGETDPVELKATEVKVNFRDPSTWHVPQDDEHQFFISTVDSWA